jgi:two-component system sensor histidine kinase/response regulator
MTETVSDTSYLRTLLQLGATLNVSLDLSQVLHIAIEQVVNFVKAERGFILLVEEGTNKVWGRATHGIDPFNLETVLKGKDPENTPQISRSIIEEALRDRRTVHSTNAMEDARFSSRTSVQLAHVRSVLCVPLIAQGHTLGIVYLDNRIRSGVFSDRDAEMLTAFANQAAVAIQNARLYENLRKSMEERLKLQQELHEKETQRIALEEANRIKSDYIGFVSHELRNPITTIRGYAQTLENDKDSQLEPAIRAEFYETIEAECDRTLNLINDLLDSARLEAGKALTLHLQTVDLKSLLEKQGRSTRLSKYFKPHHHFVLDIAPDLPEIEADQDKVIQIITNLLSNALKYTPNEGTITLSAVPKPGGVEIAVTDEGVGMDDEQRSRLFGRFERIERDSIKTIGGTGLGLHLTRHLVDLHGGTISCESEPGKGSRFTVFLPAKSPSAED